MKNKLLLTYSLILLTQCALRSQTICVGPDERRIIHGQRFEGIIGGVIFNDGTLTLNRCEFIGNWGSAAAGTAIFNRGKLVVRHCRFEGNRDYFGAGGAIFSHGQLQMIYCDFVRNVASSAGAVESSGDAKISHCTFIENVATHHVGAIANDGRMRIKHSSFIGNICADGAAGAIGNYGFLSVDHSDFFNNISGKRFPDGPSCGAILNRSPEPVLLRKCVFEGNQGLYFYPLPPGVEFDCGLFENKHERQNYFQ